MPEEKTILFVDDDRSARLLTRAVLSETDYRLIESEHGDEALALVWGERPDLLIVDVAMPGFDGYELCRAIKGDPETAATRVVMLTARAQQADRERGIEAGADAYITKPFSPAALLATIKRLLSDDANRGLECAPNGTHGRSY